MKKTVSIIIPCYRSENYLARTVSEILAVFSAGNVSPRSGKEPFSLKIILVNDASPDGTFEVIRSLCKEYPGIVTGIDLAKNAGQARAKMAGLPYAEGDYTVFMDDDGQHDPRTIFKMMRAVDHGFDLVYARFPALQETFFRRTGSRILDTLMEVFAAKPRSLRITSFFALSPAAAASLKQYESLHPFIGAYLLSQGRRHFHVCTVASPHRQRSSGTSGYTLKKLAWRALELCILWRIPRKKSDPLMYEIREVTS